MSRLSTWFRAARPLLTQYLIEQTCRRLREYLAEALADTSLSQQARAAIAETVVRRLREYLEGQR